jgi:hypothetical protein
MPIRSGPMQRRLRMNSSTRVSRHAEPFGKLASLLGFRTERTTVCGRKHGVPRTGRQPIPMSSRSYANRSASVERGSKVSDGREDESNVLVRKCGD